MGFALARSFQFISFPNFRVQRKAPVVVCHAMNDPINIQEIIELVRKHDPDRQDIVYALQNVSGGQWTSNGYYGFVDNRNSNQPGAVWQFDKNIVLQQENKLDIVLDILKDGQIGGLEFIDLIDK